MFYTVSYFTLVGKNLEKDKRMGSIFRKVGDLMHVQFCKFVFIDKSFTLYR